MPGSNPLEIIAGGRKVHKRLKGLYFDIDDTLLDTTPLKAHLRMSACEAIISEARRHAKIRKLLLKEVKMKPRTLLKAYNNISEIKGSNYDHHLDELYYVFKAKLEGISKSNWWNYFVSVGVKAYHDARDELEHLQPRDVLASLFGDLQEMGIQSGIVSCSTSRQKQLDKLSYLGIDNFFNGDFIIVVESDTSSGKEVYGDKTRGLQTLLALQRIDSSEAGYVGDSRRDNEAAHKARMRSLFYLNPRGRHAQKFADELTNGYKGRRPEAILHNLEAGVLKYIQHCNRR